MIVRFVLILGLLASISTSALAEDPKAAPHTVVKVTDAPARNHSSGKASVMRIAGKEEGAKHAFFAILELAPGGKVPIHRDATEEYIYFLQGTGKMTIDGTTHEVGPGYGVFMPANAEVSFEATGPDKVRVVQFFAGQGPEAKYEGWKPVVQEGDK